MASSLESKLFINGIRLKREAVPSFDAYPFSLPAIMGLSRLQLRAPVTIFVGENGSGKSTLLEAIASAWGFNPEGGTLNFTFATRSSHSHLHEFIVLERGIKRPKDGFFLRAESFYNVATEIERLDSGGGLGRPIIDAYGGKSLHEQSHGESFMTLALERFGGRGLYILDEPEAALSPTRQLALLVRLRDLVERVRNSSSRLTRLFCSHTRRRDLLSRRWGSGNSGVRGDRALPGDAAVSSRSRSSLASTVRFEW